MNRIKIILILVVFPPFVFSQTQQGVVKTRGRMVNGQLVPGLGLSGATVTVKGGNAVVSSNTGTFALSISGNNFYLENVQKKGYELVDADVTKKHYQYSDNLLYLLMETPEQQQSDLLAAERKIRKNLRDQLDAKEAEIEALQTSQVEKDSLLRILYQQQTDNERLIADMAKRYSTLDYDQLDEFYRQVSWFIENGELTRADSLLRTRGDIGTQVQNILKQGVAIQEQKQDLQKAEAVYQADIKEAARRCYGYYETFFALHQNDSAAYYLELRALSDTTNNEWQNDAGDFIREYLANYPRALSYYQRILRQSIEEDGTETNWTAAAYNNIGNIYDCQGDYEKALKYYNKSLSLFEKIYGTDHPRVAKPINNIGSIYYSQDDYSKALEYYSKALTIEEKTYGSQHLEVATSNNNMGLVYLRQLNYPKALEYLCKALKIWEETLGTEHPDLIASYNNIGSAYYYQGDYPKAVEYMSKSLAIREKIFGMVHPEVAYSYNNIGALYHIQGDYSKALEYYSKSLEIREKVLGTVHSAVAVSYNNIGDVYANLKDYSRALDYYNKALAVKEEVFGTEHPNTLITKSSIHNIYYKLALSLGNIQDFLSEHAFIVTTIDGDTPAKYQGLSGEYYILEFADWTQDSMTSVFDKNEEMRGKPKDILVMKDSVIRQFHFENIIGVLFGIKQITKEERQRINKTYEDWKKQNKK